MDDEYPELMEAYKKEPTKKVAERILGVVHVLVDKMSIAEVARLHRKAYNTIRNHCDRFKERGIDGLRDAPRSGRPPKIKNQTLDEYIGNSRMGVHLGKLSKGLHEDLGVDYSESGMRAKAHSMGWSYKKPQPVFHNKAGIEDILPWCHCAAEWFDELEKDRFDACVADQHRVENDYNPTGRLWSPVGAPIWRYKYPHRSHFYLFGGFTIAGRKLFRNIGKYTADNVLVVLKEMHRRWGQFGLIWDRASQHMAYVITDYLADHASDIRVLWFPTAWADRNPVEGFWGNLERHYAMSEVCETVDKRVKKVMNTVRTLRPNFDIRRIVAESPIVIKRPGEEITYEIESITEEPPSQFEIERCKNFLA